MSACQIIKYRPSALGFLLASACSLLSLSALANDALDILPMDKLIGTWQCASEYRSNGALFETKSTLEFLPEGIVNVKKVSSTTLADGTTGTYHFDLKRSWKLSATTNPKEWLVQQKVLEVRHFELDNPALEEQFYLKSYLYSLPPRTDVVIFDKKEGQEVMGMMYDPLGIVIDQCKKAK